MNAEKTKTALTANKIFVLLLLLIMLAGLAATLFFPDDINGYERTDMRTKLHLRRFPPLPTEAFRTASKTHFRIRCSLRQQPRRCTISL